MSPQFVDHVTSAAVLRTIVGEPSPRIAGKVRTALDGAARAFIAASPFVLVASSDSRGRLDVSPKGDAPGFIRVLDDRTLVIPDRSGNRRADTLMNILEVPRVALLCLVPGVTYTLRASGAAAIVRDEWLVRDMAVNGIAPKLVLVVALEEVFFHCPKCLVSSGLWRCETWPDAGRLASFDQVRAR